MPPKFISSVQISPQNFSRTCSAVFLTSLLGYFKHKPFKADLLSFLPIDHENKDLSQQSDCSYSRKCRHNSERMQLFSRKPEELCERLSSYRGRA